MLKKFYDYGGKYIVFFLIFNVIFFLFSLSLTYAMPFVVSLLLAVWLKPATTYLYKKTKIHKSIINVFCISVSLIFIIAVFALIGLGVFNEISTILSELSYFNMDFFSNTASEIKGYIDSISPAIINQLTTYIQGFTGYLTTIVTVLGNWAVKVATLVPSGVINLIIIILSTYYLLRDYDVIAQKFDNFKIANSNLPQKLLKRTNSIIINYIQSYSILLTITFIECMVVFSVFDIKYVFTLSILCVILDILPIVGSAVIYLPISAIFLIHGKFISPVSFSSHYSLFVTIGNIMEPKLLSKSLEIHPVLILMSIYIGVSIAGIMGVIYCIFLIAYFKLLDELNVI